MVGVIKGRAHQRDAQRLFFSQPISPQVDPALHSLKLLVQLSVHDTGYFGDKSMLGEASYVYVAQFKQGSLHVSRT